MLAGAGKARSTPASEKRTSVASRTRRNTAAKVYPTYGRLMWAGSSGQVIPRVKKSSCSVMGSRTAELMMGKYADTCATAAPTVGALPAR